MTNDAEERVVAVKANAVVKPPVIAKPPAEEKESPFGIWTPEAAGEKGFKVLLYGASGSGKTYMAGTFPDPIFLDIEGGMRTVLGMGKKILRYPKDPKTDVTDLAQVREFYKRVRELKPGEAPFKTIVIDSMNELQVLILKNLLTKFDANRQYEDQPTMSDYGKLARDMQSIVRIFIQLPFHVIFTAISTEREYPEDQVSPQFIGKKTGPDIQRMMDEIGYCHVVQRKEGPIEHVVGFESTPGYVAKDRTGKLGSVIPNTFQAMSEKVSKKESN
jgi:hypothetical protein